MHESHDNYAKAIRALQGLLDYIPQDHRPGEAGYDEITLAREVLNAAKDAKPVKDELPELPDGELKCTCGREDFRYVEDIGCYREVDTLDDGVLTVDGLYKTEGYDDGENPRLQCAKCCKEYAIPDDVEVEFE